MSAATDNAAPPPIPGVERFPENPIIRPHMDGRMGENINGPSLIRVPDWVTNPLGRYYLYFGHHDGEYIRLAFADDLAGPWRMHEPGVLPLAVSTFKGHISSPDLHVDDATRQIRMYFHGSDTRTGAGGEQTTRLALSPDGLIFQAQPKSLGEPYWRVFDWGGSRYALSKPSYVYRSRNGSDEYERGPAPILPEMRHAALAIDGHILSVYYTNIGDCPERILLATIDLRGNWKGWTPSNPVTVLAPEMAYEGGDQPLEPSRRGIVREPARQLRDPAIFQEDGRTYLLYSVAGEFGLAIAELRD